MTILKKIYNISKTIIKGTLLIATTVIGGLIALGLAFYAFIYVPAINIFAYGLDSLGWFMAADKTNFKWETVESMHYSMDELARAINWIYGKLFVLVKLPFVIKNGLNNLFGTPIFTGLAGLILIIVLYALYINLIKLLISLLNNTEFKAFKLSSILTAIKNFGKEVNAANNTSNNNSNYTKLGKASKSKKSITHSGHTISGKGLSK